MAIQNSCFILRWDLALNQVRRLVLRNVKVFPTATGGPMTPVLVIACYPRLVTLSRNAPLKNAPMARGNASRNQVEYTRN